MSALTVTVAGANAKTDLAEKGGQTAMAAKCFGCGTEGYIQSECPYCAADASTNKPPWCGKCDRITRQIWLNAGGTRVQRCPDCHPRRHHTLAQHRRCPECKVLAYVWDSNPCGMH